MFPFQHSFSFSTAHFRFPMRVESGVNKPIGAPAKRCQLDENILSQNIDILAKGAVTPTGFFSTLRCPMGNSG